MELDFCQLFVMQDMWQTFVFSESYAWGKKLMMVDKKKLLLRSSRRMCRAKTSVTETHKTCALLKV